MPYVHAQIIKVLKSRDGLAMVDILHRDDGLYECRAYTWVEANQELRDPAYWSPTSNSGLHETIEQAERDASRLVAPQFE